MSFVWIKQEYILSAKKKKGKSEGLSAWRTWEGQNAPAVRCGLMTGLLYQGQKPPGTVAPALVTHGLTTLGAGTMVPGGGWPRSAKKGHSWLSLLDASVLYLNIYIPSQLARRLGVEITLHADYHAHMGRVGLILGV